MDADTQSERQPEGLSAFLAPTRAWFEETFGAPTPPQLQGWPPIQRGEHTLILAPTGSGKTLAAFLWGIDQLFRTLADEQAPDDEPGVRLVYVSPLKALNNDVHRNLRRPLAGIRNTAIELGLDLPPIRVAVRSGDTPQRERRAMLKEPPHILITTPESLYLLLTSPKAREMFRTVHTVIVDEIHTLAGNKRGVHLALSLERLASLADQPVQRLGLSATIQPLEEVARFLGGSAWVGEGEDRVLAPRSVTIVDAGYHKDLDLKVVTPIEDFKSLPGSSVWPMVVARVLDLVRQHKTTLVFTNNRRLAEQTADRLNEQMAAEAEGRATGLIDGGVVKGIGLMATGRGLAASTPGVVPVPVHHGSVAKEARLEMERQLKAGELPVLVGTSSLELGIDIGSVDLIVQLQSPKSVAQGLQRVGRSGHLVGQTSKGRIFPTHREDFVEAAAVAGGMLRGEVEPTHTPRHPLDVLAQQIVAMVAVETQDVQALYDQVRCAYPYTDLTWRAYQATLEMLAGRYPSQSYRELRPRLSWDRVNGKLAALPGSRLAALSNGGTIPDTGAFGAYLSDGKTKLGELDEEFIYETRIGDTMMLGSQVWRVVDITDDRVLVSPAPGATPRMPFWRGDFPWRPYELGVRVGAFRREVAEHLARIGERLGVDDLREVRDLRETPEVQELLTWLGERYALDALSAWHTTDYLIGQIASAGAISSDRTIVVEVFDDPVGDARLVVHSPFGGRVNGPWGLALAGAFRERTGVEIEVETNDDGILLRLLDSDAEFPIDVVSELGPAEARERILRELPDSAVFGAHFRQNAARALLLPGLGRGRRTPFWLQRLRARDLLQIVRRFDDFPIVAETYRDCLQDVLDLPHLEEILQSIQDGEIRVVPVESLTPSPVAQSLLFDFVSVRMYEWDAPRAEQQLQTLAVNRDLLQDLLKDVALDDLLRPEAIQAVREQLQHTAPTAMARSAEELAVLLQQMGDLSSSEVAQRASVDPAGWIARLTGEGRVIGLEIPVLVAGSGRHSHETRWIPAEYADDYTCAFGLHPEDDVSPDGATVDVARRSILQRFLAQAGPVTLEGILARYAFPREWLESELDALIETRELVHGRFTPRQEAGDGAGAEFVDRRALEQIHRRTMSILRSEVQPVSFATYADFLARWQHIHPAERLGGDGALTVALQQLRAAPVVGRIWERDVLPLRLDAYRPEDLDLLCQGGELVWVGSGGADPRRSRVRFLFRGEGHTYLEGAPEDLGDIGEAPQAVYEFLRSEGAAFFNDLTGALDLEAEAVESALVDLVMAGLVTNDSLEAMRTIVESATLTPSGSRGGSGSGGTRRPLSALEEELARRRADLGLGSGHVTRLSDPARYRSAKQRVRHRLEHQGRAVGQPAAVRWVGRWTPVHRFGVMGKPISVAERAARQSRQLLARYGVVTRLSLDEEAGAWDWSPIYQHLQRMELRGELRRGYFVQGLPGLQFALPDVVERLRTLRDEALQDTSIVVMNACDPANLYGPAREDGPVDGSGRPLTFARLPSTWLAVHRGLPLLVVSGTGSEVLTLQNADSGLLQYAAGALLKHIGHFERHMVVQLWNGEPVLDSLGASILEALGFRRSYPVMEWDRSV